MTGTHVREALDKLALAEHAWTNHNPFKWEEVSVIDRARTAKELLVEEAIHIRLNHPSLNRNVGLELPRCWMAALKDTRSRPNQRPLAPTDSSRDAMAPPWLPFPLSGGPSLRSARSGGTVQT